MPKALAASATTKSDSYFSNDAYWVPVESCRTDRGPWQRVVAYLEQFEETERRGVKQAAEGKATTSFQQPQLCDEQARCKPEWVKVDVANVRVENEVDFGRPWLAWQLLHTFQFDKLFGRVMPRGSEDIPWAKMASALAICRLCKPSRCETGRRPDDCLVDEERKMA